jgi:lipoprotein-releasing system permease protein
MASSMNSWPYEWQVALRQVRGAGAGSNRFIAFISRVSMLGIALGVAALIVLLSVVNGFQVEVRDRMLGLVPHITLLHREGVFTDWQATARVAARNPAVAAAAPAVLADGMLGRGELLRGAFLRGIDPALEGAVSPVVRELPPALLQQLQPGALKVLLGQELARALGVKAGDKLTLVRAGRGVASASGAGLGPQTSAPQMTALHVAGTFAAGHFEFDNTLALLHWQDAATLFNLAGVNAIQLRLHDALQAPEAARALQETLGYDVALRDWTQVNRTWFESVQLQRRMLALILTLIVAVAAFNLVSTLVMTVTDKRGDIAILRTLGASPLSIMGIFVAQGLLAGLVGTAGGVALGLGIAYHLDVLVPALERALGTTLLSPSIYLIDHLPSLPMASDVVPVVLVSLGLSLVATLYPSWRASRVNPAEALRHE